MVPGQVGANGVSAARPVEKAGGGEIGSVHLLCMGDGLVMGRLLRLVTAEIMAAMVRNHDFLGILSQEGWITSLNKLFCCCMSLTSTYYCPSDNFLLEFPCLADCLVGEWNSWSQCSATCNEGISSRSRKVTQEQVQHGVPCPNLQESQTCSLRRCPG